VFVVVDVSLASMLMFSILVTAVGVGDSRMVVRVSVANCKVLPFAHHLIKALSAIVGHMIVVVVVNDSLVIVLDELQEMGSLSRFVAQLAGYALLAHDGCSCGCATACQR
jgi:hypothetical protein